MSDLMTNRYLSFLFFLFVCSFSYSQEKQQAVVKVGSDFISAKDFKLRIELSPYIPSNPEVDRHSEREFKKDFLYSFVAEMLWAKEADRMGISNDEKFKFFFKPLEDLIVRDALFKREIKDKVKLSANDVKGAINKSQFKLHTLIVSSNDSARIHLFYSRAKDGNKFDSLLTVFPELDTSSAEVTLASLKDERIENFVYDLELNQFTHPLKTEIGWVIFKLKNKIFTPIDLKDEAAINKAKDAIRDRRTEERYRDYMLDLLKGVSISIDIASFIVLYNKIWNTLKNKSVNPDFENYFSLTEWDFQFIINSSTADELNNTFFKLGSYPVKSKDFLADLAFNGFSVSELDSIIVLNKLGNRAKQFIEYQIITQEGYKQNLQHSPEANKDISLWRQKYLAGLFFKSILDTISVTDEEIYESYIKDFKGGQNLTLINARVLTLNELDELAKVLSLLQDGSPFSEIILNYGKTDSLVNAKGETGLKPIQLLGDIGKIAASLDLNEIYGPVQRNNSYSLIQVIEKSNTQDSVTINFDSVKLDLRNSLRLAKTLDYLKRTTPKLAEINNVKIYYDILDKVKTTSIPMFIHRFMGFGGRIAGMPLLTPFSDWMDDTVIKKLLP